MASKRKVLKIARCIAVYIAFAVISHILMRIMGQPPEIHPILLDILMATALYVCAYEVHWGFWPFHKPDILIVVKHEHHETMKTRISALKKAIEERFPNEEIFVEPSHVTIGRHTYDVSEWKDYTKMVNSLDTHFHNTNHYIPPHTIILKHVKIP